MYHLRRLHFAILVSAASASIILTVILLANNTQGPQQGSSQSVFATAASEQMPSADNDALMPADYDNLTTFELFEKYPHLRDANRTAHGDSTASKLPLANETTASNATMPSLANNTASAATTDSYSQKIEALKDARDNIIAEFGSHRNATASLPPSHSFIENITETVNSLQQAVSAMNETVNSLDRVADKLDSAATELKMAASNLSAVADLQNSSLSTSSAQATAKDSNSAQNALPPINITITANPSANVSLGQNQFPMSLDENNSSINTTASGTDDYTYQNGKLQLYSDSTSSITSGNDLITSSAKRLTGELEDGDYLIVADLGPYRTAQGSSQLALKVPCDNQGEPDIALLAGVAPDSLREIDLGEAVGQNGIAINGSDEEIQLSDNGEYCLYHTPLPAGTSDVLIVNNSGDTIDFGDGRYYVALTAKATE